MQRPSVSYVLADQDRMTAAKAYFAWQSRLVTREIGRRVIEIGCGVGNFTSMLLDRDLVIALDLEPNCVERLKERYPDRPNLRAFCCDVGDPDFAAFGRYSPDSCVCLNVLEHVKDDRHALAAMAGVVSPGGVIVLIVPAFQALYGPIDRNLGHYRRYDRAMVRRLAAATGLRLRKAHYMNTVGFFGWWVNARVLRRAAQSEGQIRIFDKYIVPLMARAESIVKPFFGQSLLVVLEKPTGREYDWA
jgi:SAM-dependent methyltransferase